MLTVSAVIPTYNGTGYLLESIQSVLSQTCEVSEIIVVDDGSPEDIQSLLRPFFPRVTYVRQANAGPAAARNHGVSIATGDVIAFLDDDDIWHPDKTAVQLHYLENNPECAMVYSYPQLIDEQGRVMPNDPPVMFPSGSVYLDFVKKNRIATPSATLIRREAFYEAGCFDENREHLCGEDYDLWLRIAEKRRVAFCPGTLVSYRVRESGISRNLVNAMRGDFYVLRKLLLRQMRQSSQVDSAFYRAFDYNLYHTYRRHAFGYHYGMENREQAASLLLAALNRHEFYRNFRAGTNLSLFFLRRRPYHVVDLFYLGFFCLPGALFNVLRSIKRKAAVTLVSARYRKAA